MASGGREDRLRMSQIMREYWNRTNRERGDHLRKELEAAQSRQAAADAFWNAHKSTVKDRWANRTGGRGKTTVADIPEVARQWHPDNPARPQDVSAIAQATGAQSPYLWRCPLFPDDHAAWPAWPKDRVQAGAGCPACRQLIRLADLPTLAAQYQGQAPALQVTHGANEIVPWLCRTWAVDPGTGRWEQVEHRFTAQIKSRALQQDGCAVCAGYLIDDTNSLLRWFPELAEQVDDPVLEPATMPVTRHNISRLQSGGEERAYATVPWMCRHGHRWEATVLNRVQGGDCPKCSTAGISKQQVRLAAELAELFELVPPGHRDPRLPAGTRDFASHRLAIPAEFKPAHWRFRDVEVDIVLRLEASGMKIGVEYDGAYHHSSALRQANRRKDEREKSDVLVRARLLDLMVHVRVGSIEMLDGEHLLSVSVPENSSAYVQACAVARSLHDRFPADCPSLEDYLANGAALGQRQAETYIIAVWGELKPPRLRRPKATPKRRTLTATEPSPGNGLTPVGEPYRRPDKPTEIVRDYKCTCGKPYTGVQSQVTYGTTTSCGCRRDAAARSPRAAITPEETRAVRAWAQQHGHAIGGAGRVPDPLTASYRLETAGRSDLLGENGLLQEDRVRTWAETEGRPLGVRGRVTGQLWLDFADQALPGSDLASLDDAPEQ